MLSLAIVFGALAVLSLGLSIWQFIVAMRFPLHQHVSNTSFTPAITILKPLKGCDSETEACLRSWFNQDYAGTVQILFGVASAEDPVCPVVERLLAELPNRDAQLIKCGQTLGTNSKVSTLVQLESWAKHDLILISDADVRVSRDFLANAVLPLRDSGVGLVNCLYKLANPTTLAMRWESLSTNADFWSQVLQARSLKPLDFALGAAMLTRRKHVEEIGGFATLRDYLADDYQLGLRISSLGQRIELSSVVVECWEPPMDWTDVLNHQVRWARTIRFCRPVPYFFSILSNSTLWPLLWLFFYPTNFACAITIGLLLWRVFSALALQNRFTCSPVLQVDGLLVPFKDLLSVMIWLAAFVGNQIVWRGEMYRISPEGKLIKR